MLTLCLTSFVFGVQHKIPMTVDQFVAYLSTLQKDELLKTTDYLEYLIDEHKEVIFPFTFDDPRYVPRYTQKCPDLEKSLYAIVEALYPNEVT